MKQRLNGISIAGALEFTRLRIGNPPLLDEQGAGVDLVMFLTNESAASSRACLISRGEGIESKQKLLLAERSV